MNRTRSTGVLIVVSVIMLLCAHYVSAETLNRVVALVNNEVITLHELNQKIKEMTGSRPEDLSLLDQNRYLETRRTVLELMIDERITLDKIQELGIKVLPRQIDAAIESIKKDNRLTQEDLKAKLEKEGITLERYREKIKKDLEHHRLINFEVRSKIIIREEHIEEYYRKHKKEFSSEGEVYLAHIFLVRKNPGDDEEIRELYKKGEKIITKLRMGDDFGELARKFSEGPGASEGGDLGVFKTEQLEPELRKVLEALPEGGFSELMERPNGIQIILLKKREEAEVKPLEEVRDAIFGILFREEVDKRYKPWIKELREKSYTKIIF